MIFITHYCPLWSLHVHRSSSPTHCFLFTSLLRLLLVLRSPSLYWPLDSLTSPPSVIFPSNPLRVHSTPYVTLVTLSSSVATTWQSGYCKHPVSWLFSLLYNAGATAHPHAPWQPSFAPLAPSCTHQSTASSSALCLCPGTLAGLENLTSWSLCLPNPSTP